MLRKVIMNFEQDFTGPESYPWLPIPFLSGPDNLCRWWECSKNELLCIPLSIQDPDPGMFSLVC
jgi:hypothetical protein